MSKKEQKTKRWDLAGDETGILVPDDIKPEPWPEWLSKSFLNIYLRQEDPIAFREFMLLERNAGELWTMIHNLFYAIVLEAKKVLQENPSLKKIDMIEYMSEDDFWDSFRDRDEVLTTKQTNAIAALRSIAVIRAEFFYLHKNYYPNENADPRTAKMLLEMMLLILAAIRGDLWENVWPHAHHRATALKGLKISSERGVEAKKKNRDELRKLCRDLAKQFAEGRSISRTASRIGDYIRQNKSWTRPPSHSTIEGYIRDLDLFHGRVKTKPQAQR